MKQKRTSISQIERSGFLTQSAHRLIYLLDKSFDRYRKLKRFGAPDILVDAEKVLIRRRLLFLFNLHTGVTD
ncbi:MAG TPA: hypothetical protein VHO84_06225 [Syntrophorhabdaceae bacterium]|nr:hypothetical protein [Syntrophorhabdaceae bacterium]